MNKIFSFLSHCDFIFFKDTAHGKPSRPTAVCARQLNHIKKKKRIGSNRKTNDAILYYFLVAPGAARRIVTHVCSNNAIE